MFLVLAPFDEHEIRYVSAIANFLSECQSTIVITFVRFSPSLSSRTFHARRRCISMSECCYLLAPLICDTRVETKGRTTRVYTPNAIRIRRDLVRVKYVASRVYLDCNARNQSLPSLFTLPCLFAKELLCAFALCKHNRRLRGVLRIRRFPARARKVIAIVDECTCIKRRFFLSLSLSLWA